MKRLSKHVPSKRVYSNDMLGHYLAGLIDGDGHIATNSYIIICFNELDLSSAWKLKSQIGFGHIRKVKNKKAYLWKISNEKGIEHVAQLICDKLKHPSKIKQFNERLFPKFSNRKTSSNSTIDWETPWFSGFFDADGYLGIQITEHERGLKKRIYIRLSGKIDQKNDILLAQFKKKFGGYLGYRANLDTYYYNIQSFGGMFKLLSFFDKFSLQFDRYYLRYIFLRKTYLLIQDKLHLTSKSISKIKRYKKILES